jgi:tetratricopeptide (TPR) repeat protein
VENEGTAERLSAKLYRVFVALAIAYVVLTSFGPMMNQVDLGWQVAQGRWILHHIAPYSHDAFNYPNLGHAVINEYTLFEIVLYLAWSLGWWGPCLLTAIGYVTLVVVLVNGASRLQIKSAPSVAIAIGLMLLMFSWLAFPLRPHLVTFVCIAVMGVFLLQHRDTQNWREFWPMALLQIAWANSHSAFVLGPAMVGLFGAEVTLRRWSIAGFFPRHTIKTWFAAFIFILLSCLVNPYGWARFYPPFFQDRLESIRAYVGEMEPLGGGLATIYGYLALAALAIVVLAAIRRGWAISYSFLFLAIMLYLQAQSVYKAWPVFAVFVPLLVLSSGTFAGSSRRSDSWPGLFGIFIATVSIGMAFGARLYDGYDMSVVRQWHEYDQGRSEISIQATTWMKAHGIAGRLFHRCEDGGWLQMNGYDHDETFSDTGFGKYDEAFIHEVGLVNERPAYVPRLLAAYKPDYIVCSNFCYQWPFYLKQNGWRLIFYSPNSSVWTRTDLRPDLPTVSDEVVAAAFHLELTTDGMPTDVRLLGRNLIALNSLGLEGFAFSELKGLAAELHHTPWYWEAARFICFASPPSSTEHRDALMHEAESLQDEGVTAEFRAYYRYYAANDVDGALKILQAIPRDKMGNYAAELLLKIELDRKQPEALDIALRSECFDLRNGKHWQYLAQAEEQWGSLETARKAWRKAVFYSPDDDALMQAAKDFAARHQDAALSLAITDSTKVYGEPR